MKTRCPALRELHLAFDTCGEGESEHDQHRNCQRVFAPGGVELKLLPIPRPSSQPLKTPLIRRGWDEKVQDFDGVKGIEAEFWTGSAALGVSASLLVRRDANRSAVLQSERRDGRSHCDKFFHDAPPECRCG